MTTQSRKKRRPLRRLKKVFSKPLARLATLALPATYLFYMNLVYRTSRITHINLAEMQEARVRHGRVLAGVWHEVVFLVAYSFREFHGSTLASRGDLGDLVARMLELCQFEVFRGGSSRGRSRRKRVLVDLIRHMKTHHNVIYGITVDGSHGPAHVLKSGIVAIARSTGAPIYATHIACRPCLRAPSWDRTSPEETEAAEDRFLVSFLEVMEKGNFSPLTANPTYRGTDHTREQVPLLVHHPAIDPTDLGVRSSFADVARTIDENFKLGQVSHGESFLGAI